MMEGILANELAKLGIGDIVVESAGVHKDAEGQNAHEHSLEELRDRDIKVDGHKSRYIGNIGGLKQFDRIFCVGQKEADQVIALAPDLANRVEVVNAEFGGIPNPWEQGRNAYRSCAVTIEAAMRKIARRLRAEQK
jgi:protein-tyrosine-phosphatase